MTTTNIRTLNFNLGVQKQKQYTMKGMSQAQANGKDYVNGIVEEWLANFQFTTIKKQIGFLKEELRLAKTTIKEIKEDIEIYKDNKEWLKDFNEDLEKWTMVQTILTDMLSVMVGA